MFKRVRFTLIFTFSFFQFFSQTTYYVAPSASGGSNSNEGTIAAPFETLAHAIDQLTAGDILYNILGTEVLSTTLHNNMGIQTISTIGMATGIYIIELESGTDRLTKKLIIH